MKRKIWGIKARIIKIIPVSVYQEKIYTQDVVVELENDERLALDDSTKLCKEDFLGKSKRLEVLIYVANSIEKTNEKKIKIIPVSINQKNYHGPYAEIYAYIEDIVLPTDGEKSDDFSYAVLNVGVGKIGIFFDNELLGNFTKGDYIRIKGARLDLKKIAHC